MLGLSKEEGIKQVYGGGGHVVLLGAGASIAAANRNNEKGGKKLPSMDNLVETIDLKDLFSDIPKHLLSSNFEKLYSNLHNHDPNSLILVEIEKRITQYFGSMELPDEPTIYDYLILSLRGKDLIATFNWDPFLYQAWCRNQEFTKNLPFMAFLHGNVAIGYNSEIKRTGPAGYTTKKELAYLEPTKLLYPIEQKNYTNDEFISREWERTKYWLSRDKKNKTVRVTIFGYGAPNSDVEAVKLLNDSWGSPDDRSMEQFEIIDIAPKEQLLERWAGFIHSAHYDIATDYFDSVLAFNPRRTSESYFSHYMPMSASEAFRHSNPVPNDIKTLEELWNWHKPLIDAEIAAGEYE